MKQELKKKNTGIKIISVLGIIFSVFTVLAGLLVLFAGGVLTTTLTSNVEPGWGILGLGTILFAVIILGISIPKLVGYIMLGKVKRAGWILVILFELITLLCKGYFIVDQLDFPVLFSMLWPTLVIIFLIVRRNSFFNISQN